MGFGKLFIKVTRIESTQKVSNDSYESFYFLLLEQQITKPKSHRSIFPIGFIF